MNTQARNDIMSMVSMHHGTLPFNIQDFFERLTSREYICPQSLQSIEASIQAYGHQARQFVEERLEYLQENFLVLLYTKLENAGIIPQEKISLHFTKDQKLIIESEDDNEGILNALAMDADLQNLFAMMQKLALSAEGLHYLLCAMTEHASAPPLTYHMSSKGALSHFYLKG